jgi:citrate lyase subunit beta / citryl-CoA lyase
MYCLRRSKLFVPSNRPDLLEESRKSAADALSFDLEDTVPNSEKSTARDSLVRFLNSSGETNKEHIVRVNSLSSGAMFDDLFAVVSHHIDVINIPKVESTRDIFVCEELLSYLEIKRNIDKKIEILPTLETPTGIRRALEIATSSPRMTALQLGVGDLSKIMRMKPASHRFTFPRMAILYAAAEAKICALDGVYTNLDDLEGFEAEAAESCALGFQGKSCITPSQVEIANRIFFPSQKEIHEAFEIITAYEKAKGGGMGTTVYQGQLVDKPIAERAKRIIEIAGKDGFEINLRKK